MEDSTPAENQKSSELIRKHTATPLAVGEVFNSIWDCKYLIENQLIDYIRTTIVHGGGITHVRRIADFAALHSVRTGFHGATDLSPVCMGAALHFDTWVPNFGIQEYMSTRRRPTRCFRTTTRSRTAVCIGESPGHGVTSTRNSRRNIRTTRASCPLRVSKTARCGTGERSCLEMKTHMAKSNTRVSQPSESPTDFIAVNGRLYQELGAQSDCCDKSGHVQGG